MLIREQNDMINECVMKESHTISELGPSSQIPNGP